MANIEGSPLCANAQTDNKFTAYRCEIGSINEDILEKLTTIARIWMLRCEVVGNICPNRNCIIQSPQSSPHIFKKSKKTIYCKRSKWALETLYSASSHALLKIDSTCDKKNNKRFYSNVSTQLPLNFLNNSPLFLPPIAGKIKSESPILESSSLAISVDLQSVDGQKIVAQKKKPKSNKNNQKGKRNSDKAGQSKKYEEKDGSDEEGDTNNNNNANRNSDEKGDEDNEDEAEKKVEEDEEDEEEKKVENEGKENAEEGDDNNKEECNEESLYTLPNNKKNKKAKTKKNGKNKAQPPDKPVVGLLKTSVDDYHAFKELETSSNYLESLVLNASTMDGRYDVIKVLFPGILPAADLDSSDKTIALDEKKETENLSFDVKDSEILKTTVSILTGSGQNFGDGDTSSILDDSQAHRFVKNSGPKKLNVLNTNELEENKDIVLSSIDTRNSDADKIEDPANNNLNHRFEETGEDLGYSNPNAESLKIIDKGKKQKKQEKQESQTTQALLKDKISKKDSESKLSIKNQDLDLIQMPGAFSFDDFGNENVPFIDKLDVTRSEIGVASIDRTNEKTYVADSKEDFQSNELAQEISPTPINSSEETENSLAQALTNESFFDNNNRTESLEMKKVKYQNSIISTKISQQEIFESYNKNSDLNDFHEPSNYKNEITESTTLDRLMEFHTAISNDEKNSTIETESVNTQLEPVKSRKEKKKEKALAEAEKKKSKAKATQQAKVMRKKQTEDENTFSEIEPNLKVEEPIELNNTEEIQFELAAREENESKSKKEFEFEIESEAKGLKNSKPCVGKQIKKIGAEQTLNTKKGRHKITGKEKGKKFLVRDEDAFATDALQDEEGNITNDEPENIDGDSNIDILHQSTNLAAPEESIAKLEVNLNKTMDLQSNNLDINSELVTEAQPGKDESTILNQDRSPEENCDVFNAINDHDKPIVVHGKDSKSKSKASNNEKKKKEGNVANKLKNFEALQNSVTPLTSSKVKEVKEPHFSHKDDEFTVSELSPEESTGSKDVPRSSLQEYVDVNVKNTGGKKSKKKKISILKEDKRNPSMNGKIKCENKDIDKGTMVIFKCDEQDKEEGLVDIKEVQHYYNKPEACQKNGDLEELGEIRNLGKQEELEELGEPEKSGKLEEPVESEKLEEPGEPEKPLELEELGELEKPGELEEPVEPEKPLELEELGELEKLDDLDELDGLGELKEPGELENPEDLGESKEILGPEKFNDCQGDETNFDESSALILSEVPKIAPFYSINLQPEAKIIKKKRPRNIRDGSPWGMLGVGPRKNVKRIAKRKSGDVKKVLRTKHTTPIKNPEKKEFVRVSPPKRADKAARPPTSRGISSIFAAPVRSKSVAERRSGATRKPSYRRQSTSEAIGISSPFIGSGNKPEISLKAAKLLGVSPSPGIIPNKKAKTNPIEHEDTVFASTKEDFTSPEKQTQNRIKKDDNDVIIESSGNSEPVMKRSESTRRTSIGGIFSGLISSRSRPNVKRRSIVTEEDHRSLRREDRKIKQSNRGISELRMSGGLTNEDQKVQQLAQQTPEVVIKKNSDENVVVGKIQKVRKSHRADRKAAEEAAERIAIKEAAEKKEAEDAAERIAIKEAAEKKEAEEAAERRASEISQKARRARRSERKAIQEAIDKKVAEIESAELAQKARRARRAEKKAAEEIAERKAVELAQKTRRAQRSERAERKATEITPKREIEKKEAAKKTAVRRGSGENLRRTSDEERRERHRRKEAQLDERQHEEREARRAARRSQRSKEKAEQRGFEGRNSEKNHASDEKLAMNDRRKDESYLEKANYRNSISQKPKFDENYTYGSKELRSSRAIPKNPRPNYEEFGLPVENQTTDKSLYVKHELNDRSNESDERPSLDSMASTRAKELLKDPLIPTSPLVSPFVEPKASTEQIRHREVRKLDSSKYDEVREERDERRRKRDSRRIQENLAIPHGNHGNERRFSHRSSTLVESKTSSAQGGFLSRWKRLAGV
ncbi:hypothetical protein EPUL_002813 [Erysiphe pulchra]|uniref:Uncharacterized protein n=1 Tax=Erysiphe pulchra TaxID=225359 RepID=A0A2S4PRQ7_9PEZI|nr:hypothetical protein EPUL_002813 [Erysiphe pulchra]